MATRELSSTLKNLKFMQRAALGDEKTKKQDEVNDNFPTNSTITRKCVVIMEGDPHPGELEGRMSFQCFNPSVEKLYEEESRLGQPTAETTVSANQNGNVSSREISASVEGPECASMEQKSYEVNGNVKRKQEEVFCKAQYPIKSLKNDQGNRKSWPKNSVVSSKKPTGDKLDWKILRRSKCQTK